MVSPDKLNILVVGGGKVALRKCMHFRGADITVISEDIVSGIENLASSVIKKRVKPSDVYCLMDKFNIIIVATNDAAINSEIRDEALRRGLYVNSAHGGGNVVIPSVLKRERYTVSVSTEGKLPAFPPFVVEELDIFLDKKFDDMFDVLAELRKMCSGKWSQAERSEFLRKAVRDPEIKRLVSEGDKESALERAKTLGVLV